MSKKKKIILVLSSVIIALLVSAFLYVFYSYEKYSHLNNSDYKTTNSEGKNTDGKEENKDIKDSDDNIDFKEIEGITNILLVGTDARTLNESARSDTIMILTLDDIHKKIKLTSIMRDTYVKIPNYGEQKITHAFAYGGIDLLKKTIELNFETKIDNFAIINFFGFKDLIDGIGGLEIDVKSEELKELNRCILLEIQDNVQLSSNDAHYLKKPGLQLLNGQQVLAYSRMRHIGNGCYDRSQRQRYVVNLIMSKLKDTSLVKYPSVANKLLPCVKTDLQFTQALDVAYTAYSIGNFDIEQLQIPANKLSYGRIYKDKGWVLLIDKAQNIDVMQKFIFDDIAYDDSKYTTFNYRQSEYYYYEPPVVEEDKNTDDEEKELDEEKEKIDSEDNQDINDQQDNDENGLSEDDNNDEDNQNVDEDNSTDEDESNNNDSILDEENPNNNDNTLNEEEQKSNDDNLDDQNQNSDSEDGDTDDIGDNSDSNTNNSSEINNGIFDFDNEDFYKNEETNNEVKESNKNNNNEENKNNNEEDINEEKENEVISEESKEKNSEEKTDEKLEVQIDKNNSDIDDAM